MHEKVEDATVGSSAAVGERHCPLRDVAGDPFSRQKVSKADRRPCWCRMHAVEDEKTAGLVWFNRF